MKVNQRIILNIELEGQEIDDLLFSLQETINLIPDEIKREKQPPRLLSNFMGVLGEYSEYKEE